LLGSKPGDPRRSIGSPFWREALPAAGAVEAVAAVVRGGAVGADAGDLLCGGQEAGLAELEAALPGGGGGVRHLQGGATELYLLLPVVGCDRRGCTFGS
jgi:hypothetical protein